MEIRIFGSGCAKCEETERLVSQMVQDLGINASVEKVGDFGEMLALGIMSTPAVAIDGKIVSKGRVPARDEIRGWLAEKG